MPILTASTRPRTESGRGRSSAAGHVQRNRSRGWIVLVAVLNAGSATAKAALVEVAGEGDTAHVSWRGSRPLDSLGRAGSAFASLLDELREHQPEVEAVGHRVVHGGNRFTQPVRVDSSVENEIARLSPFAPLHNPLALEGIRAAKDAFPTTPMVAVFDTAFHAHRPPESIRFPLPWKLTEELQMFRYGFHGTAHASLADSLAQAERMNPEDVHAVTLQLGAGCSACAIAGGQSIETSMGFSPLGGLPMATRSGDLDPGVLLTLLRNGMSASDLENLLTRQSGLLGITGSADMRDVLAAETRGDERARVGLALFVRSVVAVVGAYLTLLEGRGALIFGGGIGTGSHELRQRVSAGLTAWNVTLDADRNASGVPGLISSSSSRPVYVFETDEETRIAQSTRHLISPEHAPDATSS